MQTSTHAPRLNALAEEDKPKSNIVSVIVFHEGRKYRAWVSGRVDIGYERPSEAP